MKVILIVVMLCVDIQAASYRQVRGRDGEVRNDIVQRESDKAFIPADPDNRDYVKFLEWKNKGGVVNPPLEEPADPKMVALRKARKDANDRKLSAHDRMDALIKALNLTEQ